MAGPGGPNSDQRSHERGVLVPGEVEYSCRRVEWNTALRVHVTSSRPVYVTTLSAYNNPSLILSRGQFVWYGAHPAPSTGLVAFAPPPPESTQSAPSPSPICRPHATQTLSGRTHPTRLPTLLPTQHASPRRPPTPHQCSSSVLQPERK
eukprot:1569908-Prymnesium_polylepis.1